MACGEKPRKDGATRSVASKRRRWRSATSSCGTRRDGDGDGDGGEEEGVEVDMGGWTGPDLVW
nr:unnamed protein product [Digitaria exilis]